MTALVYTVPVVASWRRMRQSGRRHFADPAVREAMKMHAEAALAVRPAGWSLDTLCRCWVIYTPADRRPHDADRMGSLVLDALTGVLWRDDSDRYVSLVVPSPHDMWLRCARPQIAAPGTTTVLVERIGDAIPTLAEVRAAARAKRAR